MDSKKRHKVAIDLATKTAKSASFLISGKVLSLGIQVLMFVVVARLLLPSNYGIYTIALSIAGFASGFGGLNIGVYFTERIPFLTAKKRAHEIGTALGDGIIAVIAPGIVIFLVGVALSPFLSYYVLHSNTYTLIVILSMLSIVFSFLYSNLNVMLLGFHDGKNSGLALIIYSIVQLGASIFLIEIASTPEGKIAGAIVGYIIALLVASIFQIIVTSRRSRVLFVWEGMWKRIKEMLRFSMPLTYSNIVGTLVGNFSVIFLGILLVATSAVGYYGVASRIGTLIDVVAGSLAVIAIPTFAEAINSRHISDKVGKFFYYSIYFGLLFTTPMIAYVTVFSYPLITTLFSAQYAGATFYMQLIGVGLLLGIFGSFASSLVVSMRKTNIYFKYSLIAGVIEFVSLLILVPFFQRFYDSGVTGLIISMLYIGGMATNLLFMNYLRKIGITIKYSKPIRIVLANIVLAVLLSLLFLVIVNPEFVLVLGLVVALLIYPPILGIVGAVKRDDMELLGKVGKNLPILGQVLGILLSYTMFFV